MAGRDHIDLILKAGVVYHMSSIACDIQIHILIYGRSHIMLAATGDDCPRNILLLAEREAC